MLLVKDLIKENEELKEYLKDLWWMAKRYADGRRSYATTQLNVTVDRLRDMGVITEPDPIDKSYYAKDSDFGNWTKDVGFDYKPVDTDL
jgi:hypothetical protein